MGVFRFKRFDVDDFGCGMKICSDSVLLGAWFLPPLKAAQSVADIGAGSGLLSLMAADIMPLASIEAVEIDPEACRAAIRNFEISPWSGRLKAVCADFAEYAIGAAGRFDVVVCNPPYFITGERSSDAARAVARHQSSLSYSSLLSSGISKPDGHVGLVAPSEFENDIIYAAEVGRLKLRRLCRVKTSPAKGYSRILADFSYTDGPVEISELSLRTPDGVYSDEYRRLVEPYYMKL